MRKLANDIQAVINTLSGLEVKATPATIERLYGCFGVLANARNELNRMADEMDASAVKKVEPAPAIPVIHVEKPICEEMPACEESEVKPDGTANPE